MYFCELLSSGNCLKLYLMGNSLSSMIDGSSLLWMVLHFYCLFSYSSLLDLQYGGRIWKSLTTREQARETGISVREAEWRIDVEVFLDEYPRWELGALHWSVILQEMFQHATEWGHKEVERLIHCRCQGSASEPNLEAGHSAMELVGYRTSHKKIWDIYHSVYLLRRPPGLPPCGDQQRRAIHDILSSLRSWLHWHGYPATTGEGQESKEEWLLRPSKRESYEEVLRAACQGHWKLPKCFKVISKG